MTECHRTILGVFAHPDDESMGPGGTFAKYAAAGHRVLISTATAGGAGRLHDERPTDEAGRRELMEIRRTETLAACDVLGIDHLGFWGWDDGRLADHDVLDAEIRIVELIRRHRPDVVVTFHGSGISYHRDHRVMTLAAMGAFQGSGDPDWFREEAVADLPPHRAAKLYGFTMDGTAGFRDDWPRATYGSPPADITTSIDTQDWADTKWAAIEAHASQQGGPPFRILYESGAFAQEDWVRIFPSPVPGSPRETDLFAGLSSEDEAGTA